MKDKAHIILIMTDQHRKDALGCSGNQIIKTPHLDSLSAEGYRFSSAYSSTPSCTPARAALLTGQSPWNHGLLGYDKIAHKYPLEMPGLLRNAGYYTLGIGKMHYTPQRNRHGFHRTFLDESGRVESKDFVSDYRQWFSKMAPGLEPDATGIGWNENRFAPYTLPEELHPTRWTGDMAVREIRDYRKGQPLFLKVSFARPHSPYDAPARFAELYDHKDMPPPSTGDWSHQFRKIKGEKDPVYGDFGEDFAKEARRYYYGNITFIDEQIGRIISELKNQGMYENSLILFTSDHGDMLGDHHHWRKTWAYEGSAGIPMIMKLPHSKKPEKSEDSPPTTLTQPVELRDILPTFLETAGVGIPEEIDGKSLYTLTAGNENWRPWIDLEHSRCYRDLTRLNSWNSLTDGKMKYIYYRHKATEQLFDLKQDPHEMHNLAEYPEFSATLKLWRERLIDHLKPRGRRWVQRGQLRKHWSTPLHSPSYPHQEKKI